MDLIQLYKDHDINYAEEGHKHCRPGWINTECPFCQGNPGLHLGYNYIDDYFYCWRCGHHFKEKVIAGLLHCTEWKAKILIKRYHGRIDRAKTFKKKQNIGTKRFKLPPNEKLSLSHKQYLMKRNFDPAQLVYDWGISGTSKNAFLDEIDYRGRVLIPIEFEGQVVSFQTRTIRNNSNLPYIACPMPRERHHHQHLLYGLDEVKNTDSVIVVEGVFDVWRMGFGAVGVFGIEYTVPQMRMLSKFDMVYVLFDNDPQAQVKANEIVASLRLKTKAEVITQDFAQDPGGMKPDDVNHLKRSILK